LTHTERSGIRALQQHASAVPRRVRHGEPLEVTERGQLVALLMPIGHATLLDALQAAGD
jgi:prevent-host-death family protein